jgi:RNA polymerase sigma factor (sigma-70 family)
MINDTTSDALRTDRSLLRKLRDSQDQQAWETFIARYGPMIRGWCRHWFPHETEDRVQDVYCKLVDRLRTFEYDPARGRFRGWLKTLTNRLMRDLKRIKREAAGDSERFLDEAAARQDLLARLAAEFDLELLEEAKKHVRSRVTSRTWSAYEETAERGRSPAAIALALGMSVGAVHQAKHHVIAQLQQAIDVLNRRS